MALNPLAPVTDYQSMLNRVFWFTSAAALAAVWMLRTHLPELDRMLKEIDFTVAFGTDKILPMPGGYLLPALSVGILARIYRLHARVSDWLGIRECFDVDVIISQLLSQSGIDLAHVDRHELIEHRHTIMRRAFYAFVRGTQSPIDPQLIGQALDAWSWFWAGIEASIVMVLSGLVLVAGGGIQLGLETIGGTLLQAAVGLPAMRGQCKRYGIAQVREILSDPARALAVETTFTELFGRPAARRLAA
jgi:hypothetical protein